MASKEDKDFLMELKCLFLRSRNPPTSALQQIIEKIWPKYVINSSESTAYISKAHRCFDSFRNDFNKNMGTLAFQFVKDKGYIYYFND
jgi:NAD dependent epimerase/dehydratase family enzyme